MIYAFAAGEYQYQDSSTFAMWSDRDDAPVSARNYAYELLSVDETEYTAELIIETLDDHFGPMGWHIDPIRPCVAVADDTTSAWPFVVRREVQFVRKFYGQHGWTEEHYFIPSPPIVAENNCD